jgi:ankyrin repeat protein
VTAAERGDVAQARTLLQQGITPDAAYSNGFNALSLAAYEGHAGVVRLLLESGADPDLRDNERQTPLFWAVFRAQFETVKLLLDYGANVNAVSDERSGPQKLDTRISEIFMARQAAAVSVVCSKYTASGVRRLSAL